MNTNAQHRVGSDEKAGFIPVGVRYTGKQSNQAEVSKSQRQKGRVKQTNKIVHKTGCDSDYECCERSWDEDCEAQPTGDETLAEFTCSFFLNLIENNRIK